MMCQVKGNPRQQAALLILRDTKEPAGLMGEKSTFKQEE